MHIIYIFIVGSLNQKDECVANKVSAPSCKSLCQSGIRSLRSWGGGGVKLNPPSKNRVLNSPVRKGLREFKTEKSS